MKKERKNISIDRIQLNTGQLDWLPRNPRTWTQEDIDKTAASIMEDPDFLEDRPLLVVPFVKEYVTFGGNLRHEGASATKKMKMVPCVIYYPETEEDYETIKRRAMKDNGSFGKWDYDSLANDWGDLPLTDWGVPAWETEEGSGSSGHAGGHKNTEDDDFDENTEEIHVRCKPGDIWELGEHRLMCGDSTDLETVKKLTGGGTIDLLLTDPPYNVNYHGGTEDKLKIKNDDFKNKNDFLGFLQKAFHCAAAVMRGGAPYYIFHADTEGRNFREAATQIGKVRECLIWVKDSLVLGRQDYQWRHEPCLYGWKEGGSHPWFNDRAQTTVMEFERTKRSEEHPTMKPVPLFGYLMQNSTKEGDTVLDLFGGSGTSLICAEQLGRKSCTMELDPHYCDVILARWEKLTGLTAVKIQSAEQ